jgi:hypothetical protein
VPSISHHDRPASALWLACLIGGMVLACASCGHSGTTGQLSVSSSFSGRVPAGGQLKLGAVNSMGHTFVAGTIGPRTHKTLTLPSGSYTVAVWLPGAKQLTTYLDLCSAHATVTAGQRTSVTLSCQWH